MEAIADVDYVVVGAGAMGMAFTDALTAHADVSVALVDRRHGAGGLKYPGLTPIWTREAIRPQPVRVGFPCFGAALTGYVEATRDDDDEKNRVCRPSPYSNTPADWAAMQVIGGDASLALTQETDLREWSNRTPLNPSRIPTDRTGDPAVLDARARLKEHIVAARARLAEYAASA